MTKWESSAQPREDPEFKVVQNLDVNGDNTIQYHGHKILD